jgi:hypothetical protein
LPEPPRLPRGFNRDAVKQHDYLEPRDTSCMNSWIRWRRSIELDYVQPIMSMQAIVDERGNAKQRAALEAIEHGQDTDPGSLMWQVFASMTSTFLPTLVKPIDLAVDVEGLRATVRVPGVIDASVAPIVNPITGKPHRARVTLPLGFEFTEAEFAAGTAQVQGAIPLDFKDTHSHLARVHWSTHGVVR